jgi:drug/metabolite transporter (DMT)-like permease
MKSQDKAYIYAFSAIVCWSTIGSVFKLTLKFMDPMELLLFASLVACFVLGVILLSQGNFMQLKKTSLHDLLMSAVMGMLNPYLYYLVLLNAYKLLPAQEAGTLNYIWPLVLVLLSIPLLGQKISLWSIMAIVISFLGILLISTHGNLLLFHFTSTTGVSLALSSALFWALYWIINLKDKRQATARLFLNFCFGAFYVFITTAFTRHFFTPPWQGLAGAVYIGLFEMGITFILWMNALKFSKNTAKVSNLIYFSPFVSLIIIHFMVGEMIHLSTIAGLVLIITGIMIQQYFK